MAGAGRTWVYAALAILLTWATPGAADPNDHPNVFLDSDSDFCNGGWDGIVNCDTADGSAENPYVISGWRFAPSQIGGIYLQHTSKHLVIRQNLFEHATLPPDTGRGADGVILNYVENVRIEANTFRHLWSGVTGAGTNIALSRNYFEDNIRGVEAGTEAAWALDHNRFEANIVAFEANAGGARLDLNQFYRNEVDLDLGFSAVDVVLRRNNLEQVTEVHIRADGHPPVDAACNWWTYRQPNGITIPAARVTPETTLDPWLEEREPHAGPLGHDPGFPDTNLNRVVKRAQSPCYDAVPGGRL